MKRILFLLAMAFTISANAQLTIGHINRPMLYSNWNFDADTIHINRLHVGDGKFGIDSLGRVIRMNNATPAAGAIVYGNGTYLATLPIGTANQLLRTNAGATSPEWFTPSYGTGSVTSIATTSPILGGTITTTGTISFDTTVVHTTAYNNARYSLKAGSTSITTLGTITTGVWNGTTIAVANGGTGLTSLGTGITTWWATPSSANLRGALTDELGTGLAIFDGATPSTGLTLTNCTGLPISTGVSGLGTGVATFLGTPSSANLRSALTDENGSGAALFDNASGVTLGGTTALATATLSGKITTYNGITTANNGASTSVGTPVHLTGQTTAIGASTLYTADADGFYTVHVQMAITTTGGTSVGVQVKFTNVADNTVKTLPTNNTNGLNQCAASSTTNAVCYNVTVYAKSGTVIQYLTNVSGSGMQYSIDATVEKL